MIKCHLRRCLCVRLIKRETKTIFSFLQYTAQELKQAAKSGIRCSFQRCLPRNLSSHFRNNPNATFTHSFITPVPCCCCRHTPGLQGKRKKTGSLPPTACVLSPPRQICVRLRFLFTALCSLGSLPATVLGNTAHPLFNA